MPDVDDAIAWDIATLVDLWNLYGLPVLLFVVAIVGLIRGRSRSVTAQRDGSRTVLHVGLMHCALAIHGLISLIQELLSMRVQGIPASHVTLIEAVIGTPVNTLLAIGMLRVSPITRRFAIAWYILLSLLAALVIGWWFYYQVPIDLFRWSEQIVPKVLPFVILVIMLLPRVKRTFTARNRRPALQQEPGNLEELPPDAGAPSEWPALAVLTLLLLIIVCSNLAIDAADWGNRLLTESESIP